MKQCTISKNLTISGVGLHSGKTTKLKFIPANADTGIVFRRTDLTPPVDVKADTLNGVVSPLCTTIECNGVQVKTIEHLMAAINVLGIDNMIVEIDNNEVPILDGSSTIFYKKLNQARLKYLNAPKSFIKIKKIISITEGDKKAFILPSDESKFSFFIDFEHQAIGRQECHWYLNKHTFNKEIAAARTFGFEADVVKLKELGLAKGGSLDNAIILSEDGKILNSSGLRYDDEFVRHKLLDSIGDLALAGKRIIGHYYGIKSSHALNHKLLEVMLNSPESWELVNGIDEEKRYAA